MCDHAAQPCEPELAAPVCSEPPVRASTGSRRRRLWDLAHTSHCPVVGMCLPLETLRRLMEKAQGYPSRADDYEIHVGAIAKCSRRTRLAELMQEALDTRYARWVRDFRAAKTTQALALMWKREVEEGDAAGALWAVLTHPRCDEALEEVVCRNMHMLQHHAGANARADLAELSALQVANASLTGELARVQARSIRCRDELSSENARISAQLMQARAENIRQHTRIAALMAQADDLKMSVSDFESSVRLKKKLDLMAARESELNGQIAQLRRQLLAVNPLPQAPSRDSAPTPAREAALDSALASRADTAADSPAAASATPVLELHHKAVLCVGGRTGNVASYRDLIERGGGRFAHHDGGLEDKQNALDSSLAAADLVICQTGCISHNAYWKVKDFCKRTGKRCVFVENPSTSSLARGLAQIVALGVSTDI